jgi:hypothetical protein
MTSSARSREDLRRVGANFVARSRFWIMGRRVAERHGADEPEALASARARAT